MSGFINPDREEGSRITIPWLPFRLGAAVDGGEVVRLLWQSNEANKDVVALPTKEAMLQKDDPVWDNIFGGGSDSDSN